jgi:hypothetical protein
MEVFVERFVGRQNIEHFCEMLKITTDPGRSSLSTAGYFAGCSL